MVYFQDTFETATHLPCLLMVTPHSSLEMKLPYGGSVGNMKVDQGGGHFLPIIVKGLLFVKKKKRNECNRGILFFLHDSQVILRRDSPPQGSLELSSQYKYGHPHNTFHHLQVSGEPVMAVDTV